MTNNDTVLDSEKSVQLEPFSLQRVIRLSTLDGFFYCLMVGCGETYLVAFALALGFPTLVAGLLAILPLVLGSLLQPLVAVPLRGCFTPRSWVVLCATLQGLALCLLAAIGYFFHADQTILVPWFYVCATIYWATALATGPVWNSWIGRLIPDNQHINFFVGRNRWAQSATLIGLVTAGFYLREAKGNEVKVILFTIMILTAALCRFISTYCLLLHPDLPRDRDREHNSIIGHNFKKWIQTFPVPFMLIFSFLTNLAVNFSSPFFTPFLLSHLAIDYTKYTLLIGTAFIARIITSNVLSRVGHRYGVRALLLCGAIGVIPAAWMWTMSTNMVMLLVFQFYTGFVWSCHELGITLYLMEAMPHRERSLLLSWVQLSNALGMAAGCLAGSLFVGRVMMTTEVYYNIFNISSFLRILPLGVFLFWMPHPLTARFRTMPMRFVDLCLTSGQLIVKPLALKLSSFHVKKRIKMDPQ
jgi:MFS family permease